jgi:hypothetical protein
MQRSRVQIWGALAWPWWWLAVTLWSVFSLAATFRDNFLPPDVRDKTQVLDYVPSWPWWVWLLGVLAVTILILLESAFRAIAGLEATLYDRGLPGRNASEIAPQRERGRTITNQWRQLIQHGAASQFQNAAQEAEAWRADLVTRLTRKYGVWVANIFNETREDDSEGFDALSPWAEHDARGERLAQIMHDVGTARIHPITGDPL